jgi:predicted TIM-barrel fold metal-dependent hydrolase
MIVCDTHSHVWAPHSDERPWPPGGQEFFDGTRHRKEALGFEELKGMMDAAGVTRALILPPSWEGYRVDLGLAAAAAYPDRFAVMGRLPLLEPEKAKEMWASWKDAPGILGVRLSFMGKVEREWLADGTTDWYWEFAEANDIPTMVYTPWSRGDTTAIATRHPGLRLIIDHMSVPGGTEDEAITPFIDEAVALAKCPNAYVKLSGMPGCSSVPYPFPNLSPYIKRVIDAFGPERCSWGADVTRLEGKATYAQTVTHFTEELDFLSAKELDLIMGRAICRLLGWAPDRDV